MNESNMNESFSTDLLTFFEKIDLMISSGVPLRDSVRAMRHGFVASTRMGSAIREICEQIEEGEVLPDILVRHPKVFSPEIRAILERATTGVGMETALRAVIRGLKSGTLVVAGPTEHSDACESETAHERDVPAGSTHPGGHGATTDSMGMLPGEAHVEISLPVILSELLSSARRRGASDVHLDPTTEGGRIRFRIDGVLHEIETCDRMAYQMRVRAIRSLIPGDEPRRNTPFSGKFHMNIDGEAYWMRASTCPVLKGEAVTVRLIRRTWRVPSLKEMGFGEAAEAQIVNWTRKPYGLIIVTGPTGSGKTTTLYSLLDSYDADRSKVVTVETPIEYDMPGVNQLALGAETGLTWESAIQCQLQQDPDVLLVSEVVSPQVASIIVRVALSGHVMLTAFHATTARGVLRRLIAAGIERGMIAESLVGVIAQRLLRRLCPDCRVPDPNPAATWGPSPLPDGPWYKPVGCDSCHQMGYRGRTAIYETLEPTSTLLEKLKSAEDTDDSLLQDDPNEASGLLADALKKASLGVTSLEEIRRELCH